MVLFCLPCIALVLYFLVVSIFVPRYRVYIKEAWRCFLDKLKGKKCSISFDERMHKAFVMWLARHNKLGMARYFSSKKKFDFWLGFSVIIFTVVSTWLLWLLIKFVILGKSPCAGNNQTGVCVG